MDSSKYFKIGGTAIIILFLIILITLYFIGAISKKRPEPPTEKGGAEFD